jgi:putative AlgH/UPF0301 family transcriptional regulator
MLTDLGKKIKAFRQIQCKLKRRQLETQLSKLKSQSQFEQSSKSKIECSPLKKKIHKESRRKPACRPDHTKKLLPLVSRVAGFLGDTREFLKLRSVNSKVHEVLSNSFVWSGILRNIDPQLALEVNLDFVEESLVKSIELIDEYVRQALRDFDKFHSTAKSLMLEGNYDRSIKYFLQPILIIKDLESLEQNNSIFRNFLPKVSRYAIFKTAFLHYLDTAATYLALENPSQTINFANECLKYYSKLKELLKDSPEFRHDFKAKFRKAKRIMREGISLINHLNIIRYSTDEYPGLRTGSVLVATSEIGDDLFASSRVLITRFERNIICEGIILNKEMDGEEAGALRIGGPCDMEQLFYLHDNPNVRGAIMVQNGLYFGGEIEDMSNNDGHVVRHYLGYCSWMPGQLEGELFHNDWQLRNDLSAVDILFGNLNSI